MIRLEYDRVVAYHGYRTSQPWDMGGIMIMKLDGVNGPPAEADVVRYGIGVFERTLLEEARDAGLVATIDNHYGYTVVVGPGRDREAVYYQVRFSDGSMYIWLMPGPPEAVAP